MEPSTLLPSRAWAPENHAALVRWLSQTPKAGPRVVVFDWDNTCIFNDVGDATFCHQLDTLAFRLPPEALGGLLPDAVEGMTHLDGGLSIADLCADIREAYKALWPRIKSGQTAGAQLPAQHDLKVKLTALYRGLERTKKIGSRFAYGWIAAWLAGFRPEEVRKLTADAIRSVSHAPKIDRWESSGGGKTGRLTAEWKRGVRALPEIQDLMHAITQAGMTVYVVTASAEAIVQGAATTLGYPVPIDRIFGMRLRQAGDVYMPMLDDAFPATTRQGKVQAIERYIPTAPVLVAGDYSTDYEMLTHFPATEVRLVINRCCQDEMQKLYKAALQPPAQGPITLLQGRDENAGCLRPAKESILFGEKSPRPL